jgi:DNA polymerase beta domain protein region
MNEIEESKNRSKEKLASLKEAILTKDTITSHKHFCIYTTGSYGREEAGEYSDIDLFFVSEEPIKKIDKILIDADLITITKTLEFPEFTGDGEYLEVHRLGDIIGNLGSRIDDYKNYFTARMLLILESKCVYNEEKYNSIIDEVLDKYYIDVDADNELNFRPTFLINDIIRYWRTLCLNYEYSKNKKDNSELENKIKSHIKNYKLKFSRKLTCYSLLLSILYLDSESVSKEKLKELIVLTPLQRLSKIEEESHDNTIKQQVRRIMRLYNEFLEYTHQEMNKLKSIFANNVTKREMFKKADDFSEAIFQLMLLKKESKIFKYFLV